MKTMLLTLTATLAAGTAMSAGKPLQVSLTPNVAIHGRRERIEGLALSLWGENPQSALALGLVNGSTGSSSGLSLGLLMNYADSYHGVQLAPVNYVKGDILGWQGGVVNYTDGEMKGLQSGVVNYAGRLKGLQLGLINYAESVDSGLQLGLINLMPRNRWFTELPEELAPAMVFINWHF